MTFPDSKYKDAASYFSGYFEQIGKAARSVNEDRLVQAATILTQVYTDGGILYSCGNGGSAAIANHLVCDHCKLVRTDTDLTPRIVSLSTTVEIITAIGNDFGFEEVFAIQVKALASKNDLVIGISTSGNSINVINGIKEARKIGSKTVSLTGSRGGNLSKITEINIKIPSNDTQRIQESHILIGHMLCEFI